MKKAILWLLLFSLVSVPLAGCASSPPEPATTPDPGTTVPTPDTTPTPETTAPTPDTTPAPVTTEPAPDTTPAPVTTEPAPDTTPAPVTTEPAPDTTPAPVTTEPEPVVTDPAGDSLLDITPAKGNRVKVACIGDSLTFGYTSSNPATKSYPYILGQLLGSSYLVGNFGKSSAYVLPATNPYNIKDKQLSYRNTEEYKSSLAFEPDVVIIMLGTNDLRSMSCDAAIKDYQEALCDLAKEYAALPTVKKVYLATSPQSINAALTTQLSNGFLQQLQREAAASIGFEVLDLYAEIGDYFDSELHTTQDRVHPTDALYSDMAHAFHALLTGAPYTRPTAPLSESGVVYLSASGRDTNDGSTPDRAVATLPRAVSLLRNGGTLVLTGVCNVNYEMNLPQNSGRITVTSSYNGNTYNGFLMISKNLTLNGDFTFENMTFRVNLENSIIACNYHDVTFGDGLSCVLQGSIKTYPLILAGYNVGSAGLPADAVTLTGSCNITVNSGTWVYVRSGNRRGNPAYPLGDIAEGASLAITINGGVFTNPSVNLTAATGMNTVHGTCTLTINGGEFRGALYAVGRVGDNKTGTKPVMDGTVNLIIRGGNFAQGIAAVQDSSVSVTGKISITLTENTRALESKLSGFTDIRFE